jgi:hypothetical protein
MFVSMQYFRCCCETGSFVPHADRQKHVCAKQNANRINPDHLAGGDSSHQGLPVWRGHSCPRPLARIIATVTIPTCSRFSMSGI